MTYEQNPRGQDDSFSRARDEIQAGISQTTETTRQQAQQKIRQNRERAAGELDTLAHAVGAAAEDLREHDQGGLSRYVGEIADSVSSVAISLRHKSVDELVHDVQQIARKNPTLFVAGSLAIGLGVGRFARASSRHQHDNSDNWSTQSGGSPHYGDGDFPSSTAGDAYPENAAGYGSERVSDDDYRADDFTATEPEGSSFEQSSLLNENSAQRGSYGGANEIAENNAFTSNRDSTGASEFLNNDNLSSSDLLGGRQNLSERDQSRKQKTSQSTTAGKPTSGNGNSNPFGGDYE